MFVRPVGVALGATVLCLLCAGVARGDDACWNLLYSALRHNAAVAQAPFVSYSESLVLDEDNSTLLRAQTDVTYREDGVASILDSRFPKQFLSLILDPGPPVLGPYGGRRDEWLNLDEDEASLPLIASTKASHVGRCLDLGDQTIDGGQYAHLVFPDARTDRPALKAIWIDRHELTVRRAVEAQYITLYVDDQYFVPRLADYTLEVERVNGYDVIAQINWNYSYWQYGQRTHLDEEYRFGNYRFGDAAPAGTLFASLGK